MEELKPDYRNKIVEIYRRIAFADESLPAQIENIIFEWVKSELEKPIDKVFKAKPELKRCFECPIKDNCKFKVEVPHIDEIAY